MCFCTYSQNKLDEALLNSGRVSDALVSLLEWLQRTEEGLSEKQPVLGDVDTVSILIEQHRVRDLRMFLLDKIKCCTIDRLAVKTVTFDCNEFLMKSSQGSF